MRRARIFFHRISEHADGKRRRPAPIRTYRMVRLVKTFPMLPSNPSQPLGVRRRHGPKRKKGIRARAGSHVVGVRAVRHEAVATAAEVHGLASRHSCKGREIEPYFVRICTLLQAACPYTTGSATCLAVIGQDRACGGTEPKPRPSRFLNLLFPL